MPFGRRNDRRGIGTGGRELQVGHLLKQIDEPFADELFIVDESQIQSQRNGVRDFHRGGLGLGWETDFEEP
ncbi:MAG: hypothetical protein QM775_04170 [Pirellulales bacterium]